MQTRKTYDGKKLRRKVQKRLKKLKQIKLREQSENSPTRNETLNNPHEFAVLNRRMDALAHRIEDVERRFFESINWRCEHCGYPNESLLSIVRTLPMICAGCGMQALDDFRQFYLKRPR